MKRYFGTHVKAVNDDGSVRFRLTEKKIDRYGEVVLPKGAVLKNYKKNPIVLWAHNFGKTQVPIGRVRMDSVEITNDFFDADIEFDDEGEDDFAKMIADKVKNGFINAGSIGFRAIDISKEPVVEGQTSVTHKKWELLEFSIVPIPALASSLAKREWAEFADKCKEFNHPIDSVVDDYFTYENKSAENTREFLESRLEGMAEWIETLENKINSIKDLLNTDTIDKVDLLQIRGIAKIKIQEISRDIKLSSIITDLKNL